MVALIKKQLSNLDAAQSMFFSRDLETILSEIFAIEYPALKGRLFVPAARQMAPSGAETITYRMYDRVGMAKVIANYASDVPRVDMFGTEVTSKVRGIVAGFGYNLQEIRAAAMMNVPLTQDRAKAARDTIEEKLDEIIAVGDSETGLVGFLNNSNVPQAAVATVGSATTFAAKLALDPDLVADDVADMIGDQTELTKDVEHIDTILMPPKQMALLKATRLVDQPMSVMAWLQSNFPEITFGSWYRLKGAGDSSTDRMVGYKRDPSKVSYQIPQEFEALEVEQRGMEYLVNCHARSGGVIMTKPLSVSYRDGI